MDLRIGGASNDLVLGYTGGVAKEASSKAPVAKQQA